MKISYIFGDKLYLNITNRCVMACPYCIKRKWENKFCGNDLKLDKEPNTNEIISSIGDPRKYKEVVFCGYGDCLIRPAIVKKVAEWLKMQNIKVRINTAGLANYYYGKNILKDLEGLIDVISISLNGSNPQEHNYMNKPMFKEKSFDEILKFVLEAKKYIPEVFITAVEFPGFDITKVKEISKRLGVKFRSRPYLNENEQ
ncbi:MAG: TatD family nuclease-associated radical SAM protein [Endomicrobium sp.]|jgi:TatD DNase family protein|uniref:TatD family nuclease-associated radical SAM protein n=1 Tax=Candidatus Endomicrobiellum cubanum TaxID=3242325 RepID=UPI002829E90F|nr:TatD family nuclease-associated radical SAM protein [Endomicrobium sp.]